MFFEIALLSEFPNINHSANHKLHSNTRDYFYLQEAQKFKTKKNWIENLSVKFNRRSWNSAMLPSIQQRCVIYMGTKIGHGDSSAPFHISVYDKREDFEFRIVNFPFMDRNILANRVNGVYVSQLVRCARICTAKVDFMPKLRRLSSS